MAPIYNCIKNYTSFLTEIMVDASQLKCCGSLVLAFLFWEFQSTESSRFTAAKSEWF